MKLETYRIITAKKTIRNTTITIPVYVEFQTSSTAIEQYCFNNFNSIIFFHELTMNEMHQLAKMKAYIKNNLTQTDIKELLQMFVTKGWFTQQFVNSSLYKFKVIECRCRMGADKLPFILMDAEFSIDLKELINWYIKNANSAITFQYKKNRITSMSTTMRFNIPFPYILTFERSYDIQQKMSEIISQELSKNSELSRLLDKHLGLKKTYDLRKEITWLDQQTIKILIKDATGLLKARVKKHWIPLTFGAIILHERQKKKKQLELMHRQLDVIQKMKDLIEAAKEEDII